MKRSTLAAVVAIPMGAALVLAGPAAWAESTTGERTADTVTTIRSGDGDTLRAIFYEDRGFDGDELWYWGSSRCSASLLDADYSLSVMPAGWDNRISSVRDYNYCDVSLYKLSAFGEPKTGYVNYGSDGRDLNFNWNDQTSSFRVS